MVKTDGDLVAVVLLVKAVAVDPSKLGKSPSAGLLLAFARSSMEASTPDESDEVLLSVEVDTSAAGACTEAKYLAAIGLVWESAELSETETTKSMSS